MLEPQTDEEQKALRLDNVFHEVVDDAPGVGSFSSTNSRAGWRRVLAEARAIFREEQAANEANPRRAERLAEEELAQVRDDITNTKDAIFAVDIALGWDVNTFDLKACRPGLVGRLVSLIYRECELMAKTEPEGGK
jgi:hypothetical protein